jgi:two-component system, NtrC family, sensor kinase
MAKDRRPGPKAGTPRAAAGADETELDRLRLASALSGGLAHEVSNMLMGVLTNLEEGRQIMANARRRGVIPGEAALAELSERVDEALHSADAIAALVRDHQAFLRPEHALLPGLVDPRLLVERAVRIAYTRIRAVAEIRLSLATTPPIQAPVSSLTQISLNLLLNAADALEACARENKVIEIRLGMEQSEVVLEISDNGPGLDPSAQRSIFEPHYTSKKSPNSLGLGLAICHALVQRLGGELSVRSKPNEGTTFRVTLPPARLA